MIVDELIAILGYDVKGEGELRRFNDGLDRAQKSASGFAKGLIALGAAAGVAAVGGLSLLAKSVISTSAEFEGYAATLETIEGSADKAKAALDWVSDFGKRTPYDVAQVTQAFVRLRAYGLDPTNGLLEDLGNASSAMGKTLMDSVEMIADASTGEFERMKEFGLRASQQGDQVTFSWTENGKSLSKTVKKSGDEITKFIQERFSARFSGAMIRQSKTWNGMIANLGDSWVAFQRKIGDSGFFNAVKNRLGDLADYLGRLDADGTLDKWAAGIGKAMTKGLDYAIYFGDRLRRHFEFLRNLISIDPKIFAAIATGLGLVAAIKFPFLASLFIIEDLISWAEGGQSAIGDLAKSLSDLTGIDADTLGTIIATLAGATALAAAAVSLGIFTGALNPLTAALLAFAGAFAGAKAGLDYLGVVKNQMDAKVAATIAQPNPANKPGYIESAGYDDKGEFIHMNGNARVDRPAENPRAGFTGDAIDYLTHLQNLEGNLQRQGGAAAMEAVVNDNKQDNRDQSVTVQVGGVTVQGVQNATGAVGAAVGQAVGNAAAGAGRVSRFERDDAF